MAQIINDPNRDLASSLGRATGKGLATGLESLLQNKIQEIHQQKQHKSTTSGLQALLGVDEDKAAQLAMLEPDILKEVVKGHFKGLQNPQEQLSQSQNELPNQTINPLFSRIPEGHPAFVKQQQQSSPSQRLNTDVLLKNQPKIKQLNKSFNQEIDYHVPIANQLFQKINEALAQEEENKTPENALTRSYAQYAPGAINPYSGYKAITDEIALLKSQKTGRPSVYTTQLTQASKPNVQMSKKDRVSKLKTLKDEQEAFIELGKARDEIIDAHNGLEPANLRNLTNERAIQNNLPDANTYKNESVIEIFSAVPTLKRKFIKINGQWIPYKKKV